MLSKGPLAKKRGGIGGTPAWNVRPLAWPQTRIPLGSWLALLVLLDLLLAIGVRVPALLGLTPPGGAQWWVVDVIMLSAAPFVVLTACRLRALHLRDRAAASAASTQVGTMMRTSREWLWAVDSSGTITFSSPMCEQLIGYTPAELIGSPMHLVLDPSDLAAALVAQPPEEASPTFSGLAVVCRHRNGSRILMETTGQAIRDENGQPAGFEGMARAADDIPSSESETSALRARVSGVIRGGNLRTAFQPIHSLSTGTVIGAEALSRFGDPSGTTPEAWFMQAASVGLGIDLELLAAQTAAQCATALPSGLYVAINLSPAACLDPRATECLLQGPLEASRLMIEITERHEVTDYAELRRALTPLRDAGARVAIDDAGAGYASMRHIIKLTPDVIKLDRTITRDIDTDAGQRALAASMVGLAGELNATILAEGIETAAELHEAATLGITAGQGYLLGRPSLDPEEWATWAPHSSRD